MSEFISEIIKQYGAFILGFIIATLIKVQWLSHRFGAVKIWISIDGEKLK